MDEIIMAVLAVIIFWLGYGLEYMTGVIRGRDLELKKVLEIMESEE